MRLLAFLFSAFSFGALAQGKIVVDKVAAQVGENIILLSDIEAQKTRAVQTGYTVTPETDCQILEDLMFQNLLLNQAELDSIEISDAQVDAEMENRLRIIEQQIGGREKMEAFYGKSASQMKNEFRPLIKKQLMTEEMERQITQNVSVSPREIREYFETIPADSIPLINAELSFQQIVVFPEITKDDKLLAYNRLNDLRNLILSGARSFESVAKRESMDPGSAQQGGVIQGTRGMMVAAFEAAVFSLKQNEISPVFESEYGYHIVQLLERKGDDYTCRHILIIPEFNRESLARASDSIDKCYSLLKTNQITWDNAVIRFSNDQNTKQNRGIITNPYTGSQAWSMENLNDVDQQIYLLTDALETGGISSPSLYFDFYERKQGIRIVRLMNRTSPHRANLNDDYALIQNAAENHKKDKILKEWTDSKIQNAYIRIDESYAGCKFNHTWTTNL